jgi:hypothetical protein
MQQLIPHNKIKVKSIIIKITRKKEAFLNVVEFNNNVNSKMD